MYRNLLTWSAELQQVKQRMGSQSRPVIVNQDITPVQQMLSSCTGALVTSIVVTPLDVVKIRLQAQQKEFAKKQCFLYCNGLMDHVCYCNGTPPATKAGSRAIQMSKWFKQSGHFNGTIDAFIKIARNEGVTSLWSGLPPTLVMAVPATVIYFTIYDQLRARFVKQFNYKNETQPPWLPMLAGGLARSMAATIISPLELIRTKMQSQRLSYAEMSQALRQGIQTQGILSLWRGLGPTILRDVPFSALYWLNYEYFKARYDQRDPTFRFSFMAGAAAGTIAAVITLPFDVVKTYRQIEVGEAEVAKEAQRGVARKDSSTLAIMRKIYAQRGAAGLFAGIVPRVVKVAPACAIMISTYEFGKAFFRQYNSDQEAKRS